MAPASPPDLILASTSAYRRALLERLGVPFRGVAPEFDEEAFPRNGLSPRALAEALARGKADAVAAREPAAVVIGCDQLEAMSGRAHELITAMVVVAPGRRFEHTDVARLAMRPLGRAALERYVARDLPVDCAGSYKLERGGIALFERIESDDHTAITGLPLLALAGILAGLGFDAP